MVRRLWILGAWVVLAPGVAAQRELAGLLALVPDDAVAVAAASDPAAIARAVTAVLEPVPVGVPDELVGGLAVGLVALRAVLGAPADEWLERIAGGGAVFALRPGADGRWEWIAVARPSDLAAAAAWCERRAPRVPRTVLGDRLVLGGASAAAAGRWAATDLGARAVARPGVVARVDLAAVRARLPAGGPSLERLDGGARFALSPLVHAFASARWLELELDAGADRLRLRATADASLAATAFATLLARAPVEAVGAAAVELDTAAPIAGPPSPAAVATLRLGRSLRALLAEPERFLDADGVQAVRGFLSIADVLDGPRSSFVDDLLGGLREPFVLHVFDAVPPGGDDVGPLVPPGLAVSAELADPGAAEVAFRTARLLAAIANSQRAQRGELPFVVRNRVDDTGRGVVAEPPSWRGPGAPPVDRQLSPTVWAGHGRLAIASTGEAARAACRCPAPRDGATDRVVLHGPALAAAIRSNLAVLELARMLDEGEDRREAARFFAVVTAVASAIETLAAEVAVDPAATTLRLELVRRR